MNIKRLIRRRMVFDDDHAQTIRDFAGNWLLATLYYMNFKNIERVLDLEEPEILSVPPGLEYWLSRKASGA